MNESNSSAGCESHAVVVEGLKKQFRIPKHQVSTLKERALHPLRRTEFRHIDAINDVSFAVEKGEFFGIVGRNGSGKSTLLKCLAGIYRVDTGRIGLRGRLSPFIELGVGFNPDLTARENVLINAIMLGLTPAQAKDRFDAVIDFAELHEFLDLKLKNYSSGMHVRLAFSVMIQVDADILLIDEILAVGDAAFQQKCFDAFHDLREQGKTLLLVTHDMASVQRFCDRAMLLENGSMVEVGEPFRIGQLYNELNFRRKHLNDEVQAVDPHASPAGEDPLRYGSGAAQIVDAWFENGAGQRADDLPQGELCRFCARITCAEDLTDPVFSVALENENGVCVFATSTIWASTPMGNFASGDEAVVTVEFENVLAPGRYNCTPSLARHGHGQDILDLRRRLLSVVVFGTRATGGVVDIDHEVKIERVEASTSMTRGAVGE